MTLVPFKFKKANAPTRVVHFEGLPTWEDLSYKISQLFHITQDRVAVAYLDKAKDAVTLASEQELRRYLESLGHSSDEIRFVVQDLKAPDATTTIASSWSVNFNLPYMSQSGNDFDLTCWVFNKSDRPFTVTIGRNRVVDNLKTAIKNQKKPELDYLAADALNIFKLSPPIPFAQLVELRDSQTPKDIEGCVELNPLDDIREHFPSPPGKNVCIIVHIPPAVSPQTSERPAKRPRLEGRPRTPSNATQAASVQTQKTPPRLSRQEVEHAMLTALEPFTEYIAYLAEGKLDGYFESTRQEDLVTPLKVKLPTRPMLLLHDLGNHPDMSRIKALFVRDTVHIFAVSGSGKTRLSLEGLCHNWGFYISCRGGSGTRAAGSSDFEMATKVMETISTCDQSNTTGEANNLKNVTEANRAFAMLICARVFVLTHLLKRLPIGTDGMVARRRWVLAQVLPPSLPYGDDIFVVVLKSLRAAETTVMLDLTRSMLSEITRIVTRDIFPAERLFVVVDEAQVAAEYLKDSFRSFTTGVDMRPVLHALYGFLGETKFFQGIILAETGLSINMVKKAVSCRSAQRMDSRPHAIVFVEVGRFTKDGTAHENYIRKYLSRDVFDERLVNRILYWFSGRYRFTASLIELLLYTQPHSPHRVLSAFVHNLTGFTITDAIDLEEGEPLLTDDTLETMEYYEQVGAVDRLFDELGRAQAIQCLFQAFMRWRIGSESTCIPIEGNMHETVVLGMGHLEKVGPSRKLESDNYPVYLCEPLVVLYLSSVFNKRPWSSKQAWIAEAFHTAPNKAPLGFLFEHAVLLVLLDAFGGKPCTLSHAFHCNQPWGSRKVTLVSLKRRIDGAMQSHPVSWTSGSSDRLGFKAESPADILNFLNNPDGKCFVFPDVHMGPDLLCYVQDEETQDLTLLALQVKFKESLNVAGWRSALDSITPQFFYTANTKDGRMQYAPSEYPHLSRDIMNAIQLMLGSVEYKPLVDEYRTKLPSTTKAEESFAQPPRKVPRFLRVIATKDADGHWESECKGDVGVLRWELVKKYIGSTADILMTGTV